MADGSIPPAVDHQAIDVALNVSLTLFFELRAEVDPTA
jgi:hypothetical protein